MTPGAQLEDDVQLLRIRPHAREQSERCIVVGLRSRAFRRKETGKQQARTHRDDLQLLQVSPRAWQQARQRVVVQKHCLQVCQRVPALQHPGAIKLTEATIQREALEGCHQEILNFQVIPRSFQVIAPRTLHHWQSAMKNRSVASCRIFGALSAGMRTNGSVPVSALDRRSKKRRLAMPDQLRGSINASLLNAKRTICSLLSLPISSGSCPLRAFLCAAAAGLTFLLCYCMQGLHRACSGVPKPCESSAHQHVWRVAALCTLHIA